MKKVWIPTVSVIAALMFTVLGYCFFDTKRSATLETERLIAQIMANDADNMQKTEDELRDMLFVDISRANTVWNRRKVLAKVGDVTITKAEILESQAFYNREFLRDLPRKDDAEKQAFYDTAHWDIKRIAERKIALAIILQNAQSEIILTEKQKEEVEAKAREALPNYSAETPDFAKRWQNSLGISEEEFFETVVKKAILEDTMMNLYADKLFPQANYTDDRKRQQDLDNFREQLIQKAETEGQIKRYY